MNGLEELRVSYHEILPFSRPTYRGENHEVGKTYWSAYWGYTYTVVALSGYQVTCRKADGFTWSHMTPLESRDRVVIAGKYLNS